VPALTAGLSPQLLPLGPPPSPPRSDAVVELAHDMPSPVPSVDAVSMEVPAAQDATATAGHEETPWELVKSRRSVSRTAFVPPAVKTPRPPPPAWLNGRCLRCHEAGHWASVCCEPLRCNNCRQVGHKAKVCTGRTAPRPPPIQVRHTAQLPAVRPRPWQRSPPSEQTESHRQQTDVQLLAVLAAQAKLLRSELQGCLARVESFLLRAEAALGKPAFDPAVSSSFVLHAGSTDDGEVNLYGCFSPRRCPSPLPAVSDAYGREDIIEGMAPVMLLMPELQESCGKLAPLQPMVQEEVGSLGPSGLASMSPTLEPSHHGDLGDDMSMEHLLVDSLEASAVPLSPAPPL
jgi:hypothetical protein